MMMVSRLSLALWLVASTPSVASPVGAASCGDEDTCHSDEVSLLQLNLDVDTERPQADSPNFYSSFTAGAIPSFTVNLDDPPYSRWNAVTEHYVKTGLLKAMMTEPGQPSIAKEYVEPWKAALRNQIDDEFIEEARGMLDYSGKLDPSLDVLGNQTNYSVIDLLLDQVGYEMNYPEYCSGVLAAMPNGTVVHGRNLDYVKKFMWKGKRVGWPELTVDVTFMRGGQPLFSSVTWPFQLGIHTAMRFGGWTFQQNTRRTGNDMKDNLAAMQQGGLANGLFARRVMEQVPDFETAVQKLWSAKYAATQYFIMSGAKPYEGGVLSIDRLGKHLPGTPPLMRLSPESTWHLVQTNDDINGIPGDIRRPVEEVRLSVSTQSEVSPSWMFGQMGASPLFNPLTTFTWVGVPAMDYSKTRLPMGSLIPRTEE